VVFAGLTVVTLGVIAIPVLDLRLGMPDDGTAAPDTTQRKAYDLVAATSSAPRSPSSGPSASRWASRCPSTRSGYG
jgi:hypothetical protein